MAQCLGCTAKKFWTRVLGSVFIHLYTGECTQSVARALGVAHKRRPQ